MIASLLLIISQAVSRGTAISACRRFRERRRKFILKDSSRRCRESHKGAHKRLGKALKVRARGDNSRELIKRYINNHARMARIAPEAEAEGEERRERESEEKTSRSFIPAFSRGRRKNRGSRRGSLNDTERAL